MYSRCKTTFFTTIVLMFSFAVSSLAQNSQPKQNTQEVPTVIAYTMLFGGITQDPEIAAKAGLRPSDTVALILNAAKFERSLVVILRTRRAATPAEQSALVRTTLADLRHDLSASGFRQFQTFFETEKSRMHRTVQLPASGQGIQTL
jgi:hypothetical protein